MGICYFFLWKQLIHCRRKKERNWILTFGWKTCIRHFPFGADNYLHTHFYEDAYIPSQDLEPGLDNFSRSLHFHVLQVP